MSRDRVSSTFMETEVRTIRPDLIEIKFVPLPGTGQPAEVVVTNVCWKLLVSQVEGHLMRQRKEAERDYCSSGLLRTA